MWLVHFFSYFEGKCKGEEQRSYILELLFQFFSFALFFIMTNEESNLIEFANFIGDRALPEYSKSENKWRWWDNDKRDYVFATTEELLKQWQAHNTKKWVELL